MIAHISKNAPKEQTVEEHLENTARLARHLGQPLGMGNLAWLKLSIIAQLELFLFTGGTTRENQSRS